MKQIPQKHHHHRHPPHSLNTSSSKLKKSINNKQLKTIDYLESSIVKNDVLNC